MNILFQCLGISGLVFIFYGLLASAITQHFSTFFWSLIGVGSALLLAYLVNWVRLALKTPTMLRDIFQSKSVKSGAGSLVYTIIVVFMIVVINVLSQRFFHVEKDFTANKIHTLADQTIKQLTGLTEKLKIIAFLDEKNEAKPMFKILTKKYEDQSKNVEVKFIDADRDKLLAEEFNAKDGDVFVEYKGQKHMTRELSEEGLSQAIAKLNRTSTQTVCFTTGHGELNIEGQPEDPRSASFLKQGLSSDGFNVRALDTVAPSVAADCNILLVAGPEQSFAPSEVAAIDAFLANGGKGMFLLDPVIPSAQLSNGPLKLRETGLEGLLEKWGVKVGHNIVLEKQLQLLTGMQISPAVRAQKYGDHPITEPLKNGKQTVFDRARSVQKAPNFAGTAIELIYTGDNGASWAQADIDAAFRQHTVKPSPGDIAGPVPLAVISEKEEDKDGKKLKTQVVVVGDSDFASNGMIRGYEFNFDLVLNASTALGGDVEQISIRPKMIKASAIELSPEQANTIFYVALVALPMLVLTFGLNLWWYRRQKA